MRHLRNALKLLGLALVSQSASAAISCDAYLALNRYHMHVELDQTNNMMSISGQNGESYKGIAVESYSPRTRLNYYYLPFSFDNQGFELRADQGSYVLCLGTNECYTCR